MSSEPNKNDTVLSARGVGKCYEIYARPIDRLKQSIFRGRRRFYREFWALRDVNLELHKGEAVGIIGRNGSGKSTLLQIIAGTLSPTTGEAQARGRVAALLELGSGFNPEFTGRENVFLNGAILGVGKAEMLQRFDDIAAFADIGQFLDQPVRTYSTGMMVRLAFAVQAQVDPDILIVDEALAVGDHFFQAKCISFIQRLRNRGCALLFVSHAPALVKALCDRVLLLNQGQVAFEGSGDKAMDMYMKMSLSRPQDPKGAKPSAPKPCDEDDPAVRQGGQTPHLVRSALLPAFASRMTERFGAGKVRFEDCILLAGGRESTVFESGRTSTIRAVLSFEKDCEFSGEAGIVVSTMEGIELFAINTFHMKQGALLPPRGKGTRVSLDFTFRNPLGPGKYRVDLGYRMPVQGEYMDKVFTAAIFEVTNPDGREVPLLFDVPGTIAAKDLG